MSGSTTDDSEGVRTHRLIAACYESFELAAILIEADPSLLHARTSLGETALHFLVVENQIEAVRWLFERGATLDTVSGPLMSPLSEAAYLSHEELAGWLLDNGAAIDLPGQCALTLFWAASGGNAAIVARLLATGVDVSAADRYGRTALHAACGDDSRLAVVEILLAAGASLDKRSIRGETPLGTAIKARASRIEALLRAHGALPNRFAD